MYNKQTTNEFLDIPIILSYYWNGSKNIITGKIKSNDYFLQFKKIESNNLIKIRYSQIDNIELMPDISDSHMNKVKELQSEAEQLSLRGQYQKAIVVYEKILEIIRPGTLKANRFKSCIEDCKINDLKETIDN